MIFDKIIFHHKLKRLPHRFKDERKKRSKIRY